MNSIRDMAGMSRVRFGRALPWIFTLVSISALSDYLMMILRFDALGVLGIFITNAVTATFFAVLWSLSPVWSKVFAATLIGVFASIGAVSNFYAFNYHAEPDSDAYIAILQAGGAEAIGYLKSQWQVVG